MRSIHNSNSQQEFNRFNWIQMIQSKSKHLSVSPSLFLKSDWNGLNAIFSRRNKNSERTQIQTHEKNMSNDGMRGPLYVAIVICVYAFDGNNCRCIGMVWWVGLMICRRNGCESQQYNAAKIQLVGRNQNEWKQEKNNYSIKINGGVNQTCGNWFHFRCILFKFSENVCGFFAYHV